MSASEKPTELVQVDINNAVQILQLLQGESAGLQGLMERVRMGDPEVTIRDVHLAMLEAQSMALLGIATMLNGAVRAAQRRVQPVAGGVPPFLHRG